MRRLLRAAARLYPRAWRNRYGVEFDALLEDLRPRWRDVFNILNGALIMHLSRLTAVPVAGALVGALAGGVAALMTPTVFASSSVVQIEVADTADDAERARAVRAALETALGGSPIPKDRIAVISRIADGSVVEIWTGAATAQAAQESTRSVIQSLIDGNLRAAEGNPAARPVRMRVLETASLPASPERAPAQPIGIGMAVGLFGGALAAVVLRRRRTA